MIPLYGEISNKIVLIRSEFLPLPYPHSIIIGLESTAHYGDNIVRFLIARDYKVCSQPYQDFDRAQEQRAQDED